MTHLLTVKVPEQLDQKIRARSLESGVSKGAFVRMALEDFLDRQTPFQRIQNITRSLQNNKPARPRGSWARLLSEIRENPHPLSPEDEVLRSRRRGL